MTESLLQYKEELYAIHIIEQGVSIHSEQFENFSELDDVLLFGFISALYAYTYSMGQEEVRSIDFGNCKFYFDYLGEDRLLVIISKKTFTEEEENNLLQNLKLRYEILTRGKEIGEVSSLFDVRERVIPLELIAEIRKKGKIEEEKEEKIKITVPAIPEVKIEEFYFEGLMNEEILTENKISYIKRSLSNFFLGYKKLIMGLFVIVKEEQLTSFVYSRKKTDEIFPLIQITLNDPSIAEIVIEKETNHYKQIEVDNQSIWVLTHASSKYAARAIFFGISKAELDAMAPHLSRIMLFVNKLI
jgi:hypothetical protein